MKKSTKILSMVLSLILIFAAIGGTLAYLTDHDKAENVFTVGSVDIEVTENIAVKNYAGVDVTDAKVSTDNNGKTTFANIMPGDEITKQPTIKNTGKNEAYVRVVVTVENKGDLVTIMDQAIDKVFENNTNKNTEEYNNFYNTIFDGWGISYLKTAETGNRMRFTMNQRTDDKVLAIDSIRVMDDVNPATWQYALNNRFKSEREAANPYDGIGYFDLAYNIVSYYDDLITAGESKLIYVFYLKLDAKEEYTLFDGFNVPDEFDNQSLAFFDGLEVNVYADAIQTENFGTLEAAMETLNNSHPLSEWVD